MDAEGFNPRERHGTHHRRSSGPPAAVSACGIQLISRLRFLSRLSARYVRREREREREREQRHTIIIHPAFFFLLRDFLHLHRVVVPRLRKWLRQRSSFLEVQRYTYGDGGVILFCIYAS